MKYTLKFNRGSKKGYMIEMVISQSELNKDRKTVEIMTTFLGDGSVYHRIELIDNEKYYEILNDDNNKDNVNFMLAILNLYGEDEILNEDKGLRKYFSVEVE